VHLPEGTANDEQAQTSMKVILRRAANPVLRLDEVNDATKGALDDIEYNKGQSPFLVIIAEVLFAFLLDDIDAQCESDGNKSTSERPLEDPVRGEPKASGDPSPTKANEESTEGEDEEERDGHNYSVRHEHPLIVSEGHLVVSRAAVITKGELHSAHIIVLDDGTARIRGG